ncbi:L,D-transpeptidase [Paenibacillus cellulositrophicus]|uniref:L,D-transpeptidase n=1 Tax=Paenibacillus cellulositrophicus TaxID=562959 RepID=UPI003F81F9E9
MKNSLYLKKYVQMHPDNKMGWYLLGKEYEKSGQQGKANYCFNQSGGIYEAFETSRVPSDIWLEYEQKLLKQAEDSERKRRRIRRAAVALMILILVLIPSVESPQRQSLAEESTNSREEVQAAAAADDMPEKKDTGKGEGAAAESGQPASGTVFTALGEDDGNGKAHLLAAEMSSAQETRNRLAVLTMKRQGKWLLWSRDLPVSYTMLSGGKGKMTYQSYNAKDCACKPQDQEALQSAAAIWTLEQEELALLYSAMAAYREKNGALPKSVNDLTRPFPENWVSGRTPRMQEAFAPMAEWMQSGGSSSKGQEGGSGETASGANTPSSPFASTWGQKPFLQERLEIIVDKAAHRLAVVSGDKLIRSYKVGLGGERTPEGKYKISIKVMNPNGRDDGEFGSRGMQLSDTNYAIHGTDEPDSMGKDESKGCIRMSRADIEELFDLVPLGTPVLISKGVLPDLPLVPKERFLTKPKQDQTNPHQTYHWL